MIKIHLSRLLGEKRWTQKDLAEATGIRPSTINEWYHEFVTRINLDHVDKICEVLECDISDLIEYVPNQHKITGKDVPNVPDVSENYEQEEKTEFMQHLENAIDLSQKLNHEAMDKSIEINKSAEYIH